MAAIVSRLEVDRDWCEANKLEKLVETDVTWRTCGICPMDPREVRGLEVRSEEDKELHIPPTWDELMWSHGEEVTIRKEDGIEEWRGNGPDDRLGLSIGQAPISRQGVHQES